MKKWGLVLKVAGVIAILLVAKAIVHWIDLDRIAVSTLLTAFVGGVIFTIAIIFSGTLVDFKESERIPSELATSIKSLYKDTVLIPVSEDKIAIDMRAHVKGLLHSLISNFERNTWDLVEINQAMDNVNNDLKHLAEKGFAPPLLARYRAELSNIDRLSNRVETITRTSFIPAAYAISELATAAVLTIIIFAKIHPWYEGLVFVGAVSFLLISILTLIKDMDNPFEVGVNSYADVDLGILFGLEPYLDNE